jgi:hypothetical protein
MNTLCGLIAPADPAALIPGAGTGAPPGFVSFTGSGHLTITPSGNATLVCHVYSDVRLPETVEFDVAPVPGGFYDRCHAVITRSGDIHSVCHRNGGA